MSCLDFTSKGKPCKNKACCGILCAKHHEKHLKNNTLEDFHRKNKGMWKDRLSDWKSGFYPCFNKDKRFFYETGICKDNTQYKEEIITSNMLNSINYDISPFTSYINNNLKVTSFPNKNGDTILVIPMPELNTKFTTIKEFEDQASVELKQAFWEYAANEIEKFIENNGHAYVSTHGLGVGYFHLRISHKPKYYVSNLKDEKP